MPLGSLLGHIPQLLLHAYVLSIVLFYVVCLDKMLTSLIAHQTADWKGRYCGSGLTLNTTGVFYCGEKSDSGAMVILLAALWDRTSSTFTDKPVINIRRKN